MRVKFEEKTYEIFFNIELARRTSILFPPGQVQEGSLGFDCAACSCDRWLWETLLGHPVRVLPPFCGVSLQEMESRIGRAINELPEMRANLLFQYKKPQYIKNSRGQEWSLWNEPYYRYDIYSEQQELLMNIDRHFCGQVFIAYASPAIHDVNELLRTHEAGGIIDASNFRTARELNGHGRNTYTKSGRCSIACSKPERISNFDLIEKIKSGSHSQNKQDNTSFIIAFQKELVSVIRKDTYYSNSFQILNEQYSELGRKHELLYSFWLLHIFRVLTGVQWIIKLKD